MTNACKRCEFCRHNVARLPRVMTIVGQRDLCSRCYFQYARTLDDLAAFVNEHGTFPNHTDSKGTNHE